MLADRQANGLPDSIRGKRTRNVPGGILGTVRRNSTFEATHSDTMSRKSGFSNRVSHKGPRVQGQLPHQPDPVGRRRPLQVIFLTLLPQRGFANGIVAALLAA